MVILMSSQGDIFVYLLYKTNKQYKAQWRMAYNYKNSVS